MWEREGCVGRPIKSPVLSLAVLANEGHTPILPHPDLDSLIGFLDGVVDLHVHTAPDTRSRSADDFECLRESSAAGLRAIALKNHYTWTPDRATIAKHWAGTSGVEVIGSITLNLTVGGLYPESVSKALALDTRIVWMPTHDANHHRRYFGDRCDGLSILADRESGGLRAE